MSEENGLLQRAVLHVEDTQTLVAHDHVTRLPRVQRRVLFMNTLAHPHTTHQHALPDDNFTRVKQLALAVR